MSKSTFFTVEVNKRLDLKDLQDFERALNEMAQKKLATAVVSNMQYKKGAFF